VPREYLSTDIFQEELKELDMVLQGKFGEPLKEDIESDGSDQYDLNSPIEDTLTYEPWEPEAVMPEADEWEPEAFDNYIPAQVILPSKDTQLLGTTTAMKKDLHGKPIGISNKNPILDTRIYKVTYPDGHTAE
jgi:hypothetical protein